MHMLFIMLRAGMTTLLMMHAHGKLIILIKFLEAFALLALINSAVRLSLVSDVACIAMNCILMRCKADQTILSLACEYVQ